MSERALTSQEVDDLGLSDWRILFSTLHARYRTGDFGTGVRLLDAIAAAAQELDHHPDLELTYSRLAVRLRSHDVGAVTGRDVRLARRISELAAQAGVEAEPATLSTLELALDTPDLAQVQPFWAAVLGMQASGDDEISDPQGRMPTIWFQTNEPGSAPSAQRWHLDIRVPPEVAEERVRAALAAGGVMVSPTFDPTYTVLADPQGNRVCVCTWVGRSS